MQKGTTIKKIAVVMGANRGMGFKTCRQLAQRDIQVILTSRNEIKG
jgi:NAD(P)-dependent dehydrogenase (short-subunit alcohol dehydrogenase family)